MLRDADPSSFKAVYVICGFTDMRYGIDTLAAIIENRYKLSLFVPNTLFLFCGRRANKIKGLLWEGDGFLLLTKRVETGRFSWPRTSSEARLLSPKQFEWLMDGFGIDPVIRTAAPLCMIFVQKADFYRLSSPSLKVPVPVWISPAAPRQRALPDTCRCFLFLMICIFPSAIPLPPPSHP